MDMAEKLLRKSTVVVSCGSKVNDDVLSDIVLAKRLEILLSYNKNRMKEMLSDAYTIFKNNKKQ
jgi:hypothetical protein